MLSPCWRAFRCAVPGVEANLLFAAQKKAIIADLAANSNDKSLAGRIDPQIEDLVSHVNTNFSQYVTTSSCSGRLSLFHRGRSAQMGNTEDVKRKRGDFGRGALFQSHDTLDPSEDVVSHHLIPALAGFCSWRQTQRSDALTWDTELLQLKFEPMIIHILCADMEAASVLLQCASESGQMNSGVLSCSRGTRDYPKVTCCITSPLVMDIPLYHHDQYIISPEDFHSSAWVQLLHHSVRYANVLFTENSKRKRRFISELDKRVLGNRP